MFVIRPNTKKVETKLDEIDANIRNQTVNLFKQTIILIGVVDEKKADIWARGLECCTLVYSKNDIGAYRKKINQLTFNIKKNGKFLLTSYYPWELSFLNDHALGQGTDEEKKMIAHVNKINHFKQEIETTIKLLKSNQKSDGMCKLQIRCRACKSMNIFDFQKQTRSADEAMTWFFTCRDCGTSGKI